MNFKINQKKYNIFFIVFIGLWLLLFQPVFLFAQSSEGGTQTPSENTETVKTYTGKIVNPLTGIAAGEFGAEKATTAIIADAVKIMLGFVGALALLVFVIGGVYWVTSLGKEERVQRGRDAMVWAAIGLLVVFSSYAVLNFVFDTLTRLPS